MAPAPWRQCRVAWTLVLLLGAGAPAHASHFYPTASGTPAWAAIAALVIFVIALVAATAEEFFALRKSKPVLFAGGLIWALIAWINIVYDLGLEVEQAARHSLVQYLELMLFLLVVMAYVNALEERRVFAALRSRISERGYGWRALFWLTGGTTFVLSPVLDNLSTALVVGSLIVSLGRDNPRFTVVGCINVVVASNAGGSFSPVGDLTTLLLWQERIVTEQGTLEFWSFFYLFLPALAAWLVPATIMHFAVPKQGAWLPLESRRVRRGGIVVGVLFLATIATTVLFEVTLALPPALGMMTGLAYLQIFGYYLKTTHRSGDESKYAERLGGPVALDSERPFDVFRMIARTQWDTMLFLCGIFLAIGGLAYLGWLAAADDLLYGRWGPLAGNVMVGLYSAFVENVPTMFGVLAMEPSLSLGHWLMAALTVATGGSLLSIGSAAGVALMGQARGIYTFFAHLRWTPAIAAGYGAGIALHLWLNKDLL